MRRSTGSSPSTRQRLPGANTQRANSCPAVDWRLPDEERASGNYAPSARVPKPMCSRSLIFMESAQKVGAVAPHRDRSRPPGLPLHAEVMRSTSSGTFSMALAGRAERHRQLHEEAKEANGAGSRTRC